MSGLRTIAALLVGFLVLCALGFSVASCVSEREPPYPGFAAPSYRDERPAELAETFLECWGNSFGLQCSEALAPHVVMRLRDKCLRERHVPVDPGDRLVCMSDEERVAWAYSVTDVPVDKASLAMVWRRTGGLIRR